MGKIDKEKLLNELQCLKEGYCHSVKTCKNSKNRIYGVYQTQAECIASVIKNFPEEPAQQIQKQREIPVKTIYTLKKEYQDVFKDFGFLHSTFDTHSYEPPPENIKKYYDRTDEIDYSQIPKGSVIEFNYGIFRRFVSYKDGYITYNDGHDQVYEVKASKVIRVVELAKEVTK